MAFNYIKKHIKKSLRERSLKKRFHVCIEKTEMFFDDPEFVFLYGFKTHDEAARFATRVRNGSDEEVVIWDVKTRQKYFYKWNVNKKNKKINWKKEGF